MSALVAGSVTYTTVGKASMDDSGIRQRKLKAVFGDGALTYPSGGVPLSNIANWGFKNSIMEVLIADASNADGYIYKWDYTNNKLRIYYSGSFTPVGTVAALTFTGTAPASHTHDLLLKNAAVADGATTRVNAGANLLGANTGGDLTITGGGANGGVVAKVAATPAGTINTPAFTGTAQVAAVLVEVATSFAPASSTTLYLFVRGY